MQRSFLFGLVIVCLLSLSGCGRESGASRSTTGFQDGTSEPALAAGSDGKVYLAYVQHQSKESADVRLARFGPDGKPAGENVRVNPEQGAARSWYGDPPVVKAGAGGTVYVAWTAKSSTGGDLYLSVSRDAGETFEAPVKVSDDVRASPGLHSLAIGPNGEIYVAWLDERSSHAPDEMQHAAMNGHSSVAAVKASLAADDSQTHKMHSGGGEADRELYFAVSTDGGRSFGANQRIASDVCPCCKTSMAVGSDGKLYVSWRQVLPNSYRHIAVAESTDSGRTFTEPLIVSDDQWQIDACPVSGASLNTSANGLDVYWYTAGSAGEPGLYSAHSADGRSFGERQLVSGSCSGGMPAKAADYVVYASAGDVTVQRGDAVVRKLTAAANPTAVTAGDRLYVAYVSKSGPAGSISVEEF